ncbi:MAG TPA: hypothetical protein V6D50_02810 [Chroococcales cyanobacterium]
MKRLTSPVSVVNYMSLVTQKSCQSDTHWQAMLFNLPDRFIGKALGTKHLSTFRAVFTSALSVPRKRASTPG